MRIHVTNNAITCVPFVQKAVCIRFCKNFVPVACSFGDLVDQTASIPARIFPAGTSLARDNGACATKQKRSRTPGKAVCFH